MCISRKSSLEVLILITKPLLDAYMFWAPFSKAHIYCTIISAVAIYTNVHVNEACLILASIAFSLNVYITNTIKPARNVNQCHCDMTVLC